MITENYQTVSPAYGRDYSSAKEARAAFLEGRDFRLESFGHNGTYCSIRDFQKDLFVSVRYNKLTRVVNVKVP